MKKIGVIVGQTGANSTAHDIATWFCKKAAWCNDNLIYDMVDLNEYNLPFLGNPDPDNRFELWKKVVASYDAFVWVSPEYNHSITSILKNAIDGAYVEWRNKPLGLITYGYASSGARAGEHMRSIAGCLGMVDVKTQLLISMYDDVSNGQMSYRALHDNGLGAMIGEIEYWLK
jgi:NAD(P)H-dependent FMN reductase